MLQHTMNIRIILLLFFALTFTQASAKDGKIKYGKLIVYKGNVEDKHPSGSGGFYTGKDETPFLTGEFEGNSIKNVTAAVAINSNSIMLFEGECTFAVPDKTTDSLVVTLCKGVVELNDEYKIRINKPIRIATNGMGKSMPRIIEGTIMNYNFNGIYGLRGTGECYGLIATYIDRTTDQSYDMLNNGVGLWKKKLTCGDVSVVFDKLNSYYGIKNLPNKDRLMVSPSGDIVGIYKTTSDGVYEGYTNFDEHEKTGGFKGTIKYKNNDKYEGIFKFAETDKDFSGKIDLYTGKYTYADGKVHEWEKGTDVTQEMEDIEALVQKIKQVIQEGIHSDHLVGKTFVYVNKQQIALQGYGGGEMTQTVSYKYITNSKVEVTNSRSFKSFANGQQIWLSEPKASVFNYGYDGEKTVYIQMNEDTYATFYANDTFTELSDGKGGISKLQK